LQDVRTDSYVRSVTDARNQKPVDLFFFGRRLGHIVVSHEATNFLEPINVTGDVGAIDVAEAVNQVSEGFFTLLRKTFILVEEVASSLPSIGQSCFGCVGSGCTFAAEGK
jgi:hypothetical protein